MVRRVSLLTSAFLLSAVSQGGASCGEWWTSSACLGDTDKRYDEDASDNLMDQHEIWGKLAGFWIGDLSYYDGEGEVYPSSCYQTSTGFGWPYEYGQYKGFINITIVGTRFYQHNYFLYPPAAAAFCSQSCPSGSTNVFGSGVCGTTGGAKSFESFGTSRYERDGSMESLGGVGTYAGFVNIARPIDAKTLLYTSTDDTSQFHSQTNVFYPDDKHRTRTAYGFMWNVPDGMPPPNNSLFYSSLYREWKVTEQEWLEALQAQYIAYKVPQADRVQAGRVPMETVCLSGSHAGGVPESDCPTEAQWCKQDPDCSRSPYQEINAGLSAGAIVLIVLGSVFVVVLPLCGLAYWMHRRRLKAARDLFVGAVCLEIFHQKKDVPSEDREKKAGLFRANTLQDLYAGIDLDSSGEITKEELMAFMQNGKIKEALGVQPSARDVSVLFAAMDPRGRGRVDFADFCCFLAKYDVPDAVRNSVRDLSLDVAEGEEGGNFI